LKLHRVDLVDDAPPLAPGQVGWDRGRVLVGSGDGAIALREVQPAGRGVMPAPDWWRGRRQDDVRLGS